MGGDILDRLQGVLEQAGVQFLSTEACIGVLLTAETQTL